MAHVPASFAWPQRSGSLCALLFLLAGCQLAILTGCQTAGSNQHQPKSIEALYQDALQAASSIPDSPRATKLAQQQQQTSATSAPLANDARPASADPTRRNSKTNASRAISGTERGGSSSAMHAPDDPRTIYQPVSLRRLPPPDPRQNRQINSQRSIELVQRLEVVPLPAGARVSDIFEETDIRQAILSLAGQAEVDVLIDDQISGSCNAVIENEPFPKALEKILLPLGHVSRFDGQRYLVGVADPESSLFPLIAEQIDYSPRHLAPSDLKDLLPERLAKFIRIVEKRNLVIIEAPGATATRIVARLRELDQPVPQVELEAIICVVSPESGFRFGLDWGHTVKLGGEDVLNLGMSALTGSSSLTPFGVRNAFDDFAVTSAFVRLLAQEGYLTIRAAPRVMAKDGEKASISIARETFFSIQPSNADVLFRQDIEKVEAGIGLEIIPIVRGDKITVMIEKAEVSEDIRTANGNPDISNNPFPLINRRTVTTTVDVRDGETIVIGGLMQQQTVDQVVRIPYLSHIPLFGKLFQTVEKREQDAEVAVFISPRIVQPHMSAPSREVMELYHEIE